VTWELLQSVATAPETETRNRYGFSR